VTVDRREVLASLGLASASTLLWALGCGARPPAPRRAPQISQDVRTWLHDAVARLAVVYPAVHALAVSRRRTTAAVDVLGPGIARLRGDGVIFTVRRPDGLRREHLTTSLTADGINAAVEALGGGRDRAAIDFGAAPATPAEPPDLDDLDLHHRVDQLHNDARRSSRIVYAAALIDIDDAIVWSVAPGRDREQRLIRVRQSVARAAWNGARPAVATAEHAWSGWLDDQPLRSADIAAATTAALEIMTPGSLDDGERTIVLDPSVTALVLDTTARHLLTAGPGRAPALGGRLAAPAVTLVDDPTAPRAYGGFAFDDEGGPAAPLTLLDAGLFAATLGPGRARRPGHLGPAAPASSHLQLRPGTAALPELYSDGLILEAGRDATYDPATDRLRLGCARARELRAGSPTGRVYANVELAGSLTALLAGIDAVARDPVALTLDDPTVHDEPPLGGRSCWRSIATPALRTRGRVRARRSRA